MKYVNLGRTGTKVSQVCLGCLTFGAKSWRDWMLEEAESVPLIARAHEAGINYFDTADFYSMGESERILGRALKAIGISRENVVIATKVGLPVGAGPNDRGLSRKHIRHSVEGSLRRLGTDYIDLYQIHRHDPTTPMEEFIDALDDLVHAGKVNYIGASSMHAFEFAAMLQICERQGRQRFATMQLHFNLLYREEEREMVPLCRAAGVGVLAWSPLARGLLARGPAGNETARSKSDNIARQFYSGDADHAILSQLSGIAAEHGVPPAQVALSWLVHRGVTAPIIGVSKPHHIDDACSGVSLALSAEEIARLEEPYRPRPVVSHG